MVPVPLRAVCTRGWAGPHDGSESRERLGRHGRGAQEEALMRSVACHVVQLPLGRDRHGHTARARQRHRRLSRLRVL
jgi:hypothetical protein